jgi:hypothetical protein
MKPVTLCFLAAVLLLPKAVMAQADCAFNLRNAQELYSAGKIESVPPLLENCLKSGFTRDERIQAYKLIINAYLFDDNTEKAENYMLQFLSMYPDYTTVATDPLEFVNLGKRFDNDPRYSAGVFFGGNTSFIRVGERITAFPMDNDKGDYSSNGVSIQAGALFTYYLNPSVEVCIEPAFRQSKFGYTVNPFSFTSVSYRETQGVIDLPVTMTYTFKGWGKIMPYARAGFKTSYLMFANSESKRNYLETGGVNLEDISGAANDKMDSRKMNNYWLVGGGGFKFRIPRAYFFVDMRYNLGLANQVNTSSRNNGQDEDLWLFYLLNDDFFMDDFSINIGIAKTFYNPKQKK